MKRFIAAFVFASFCAGIFLSFRSEKKEKVEASDNDSTVMSKIYREALAEGQAYSTLKGLCETAPKRLSGSPGAQKAVEYMQQVMKDAQFDKVWLQPCMVPHWVRGEHEIGKMTIATDNKAMTKPDKTTKTDKPVTTAKTEKPVTYEVNVCALGGSVGTAANGLTADVVEVASFEELDKLGKKGVEGKIVFFNHPFDDRRLNTFEAYGEAVQYRWGGPPAAEKYGAVGALVRSVTSSIDTFPHTGTTRNDSLAPKIPAAAISTKDAEFLHSELAKGKKVTFFLKMNCQWLPDEKSYNVIGEIRGSEHPEQVIVVGGHLDAWDLGDGAHDDGAGCVQAIEAVRLFKALGIRPKHTIRAVCYMNEENGGRGGHAYADSAKVKKEMHIAGIESDAGGFSPRGFGLEMSDEQKKKVEIWAPLFLPYGVYDFTREGGGADIGPLRAEGTPLFGLMPDGSRYFDYHHTEDDLIKNVNRRELHLGAAAISSMIFLIDKYGL